MIGGQVSGQNSGGQERYYFVNYWKQRRNRNKYKVIDVRDAEVARSNRVAPIL